MPKMAYIDKKFRPATLDLIEKANVVIAEYKQMGFDLTLRQLYYQFVSKGYIENNERSYKNFGSAIDDGRLTGMIDWEAIVDRTRNLQAVSHWSEPADIIESAAYSYRIAASENQILLGETDSYEARCRPCFLAGEAAHAHRPDAARTAH